MVYIPDGCNGTTITNNQIVRMKLFSRLNRRKRIRDIFDLSRYVFPEIQAQKRINCNVFRNAIACETC